MAKKNLKLNEPLRITAELTVRKRPLEGAPEILYRKQNLIVRGGRALVLANLYTAAGSADPISFAKVGTGGSFDLDGLLLKTPSEDMTDLFSPTATVGIAKTGSDPVEPSITLVASVDNSQGNGQRLNEAGFFSASGIMFNIKTFPGTVKDNSFSLDFEWKIKVV